mgnify:CR=1 FL=1
MLHSDTPPPSTATSAAPTEPAAPADPVPADGHEPPARRRPLRRRLALPAVVTVVLQAILVAGDRQPSIDALAYLEAGRNLLDGNGFVRQGSPELHFPPVTAIGLAGLERLTGDEMHGVWLWNLGWGLITVALLTAIAWWISRDDDVTVATAWLSTTVGGLIALSIRGGAGSELPACALILASALLVLVVLDPRARRGLPAVLAGLAGAGVLVGLAYLTRPESLFPGATVGAVALVLLARDTRRGGGTASRTATVVATAAVAFGLAVGAFVVPYVAYGHAHTGHWAVTSKTKDASIEAWRDVARNDRLARDQVLYEIQPDGVSLGPDTRPLTVLAHEDPGGWLGIIGINALSIGRFYLLWQILPLFLLVPALAKLWATQRQRATVLLAAVAAWPLVTCLLFFTQSRYLMLTTATLIPFGCWGLVDWTRRRSATGRRRAWWAIGALSVLSLVVGAWPLLPGSPNPERTEQRTAGRWIAANTPEGARVMTRSFHVQAYGDRPVVALPYGDLDEVLAYARRMGVTYLVADETSIARRRPELDGPLLGQRTAPPGLRLVHEFTERDRTVRIFELDPPAPPTDEPPRPLGYVGD